MTTHHEILSKPSFRLLLIPFGGPIPRAGAPRGADMDGEFFSPRTEVHPGLFPNGMPLCWHHGEDPSLGSTRLGTAVLDKKASNDGWWATCEWAKGEPAVELIRALSQRAGIYGSSQHLARPAARRDQSGEITNWAVCEATLSTAVQNTYARIAP